MQVQPRREPKQTLTTLIEEKDNEMCGDDEDEEESHKEFDFYNIDSNPYMKNYHFVSVSSDGKTKVIRRKSTADEESVVKVQVSSWDTPLLTPVHVTPKKESFISDSSNESDFIIQTVEGIRKAVDAENLDSIDQTKILPTSQDFDNGISYQDGDNKIKVPEEPVLDTPDSGNTYTNDEKLVLSAEIQPQESQKDNHQLFMEDNITNSEGPAYKTQSEQVPEQPERGTKGFCDIQNDLVKNKESPSFILSEGSNLAIIPDGNNSSFGIKDKSWPFESGRLDNPEPEERIMEDETDSNGSGVKIQGLESNSGSDVEIPELESQNCGVKELETQKIDLEVRSQDLQRVPPEMESRQIFNNDAELGIRNVNSQEIGIEELESLEAINDYIELGIQKLESQESINDYLELGIQTLDSQEKYKKESEARDFLKNEIQESECQNIIINESEIKIQEIVKNESEIRIQEVESLNNQSDIKIQQLIYQKNPEVTTTITSKDHSGTTLTEIKSFEIVSLDKEVVQTKIAENISVIEINKTIPEPESSNKGRISQSMDLQESESNKSETLDPAAPIQKVKELISCGDAKKVDESLHGMSRDDLMKVLSTISLPVKMDSFKNQDSVIRGRPDLLTTLTSNGPESGFFESQSMPTSMSEEVDEDFKASQGNDKQDSTDSSLENKVLENWGLEFGMESEPMKQMEFPGLLKMVDTATPLPESLEIKRSQRSASISSMFANLGVEDLPIGQVGEADVLICCPEDVDEKESTTFDETKWANLQSEFLIMS